MACIAVVLLLPAAAAAAAPHEPRCLGAESREPGRACRNPALRLRVTPSPERALLEPSSACALTEVTDLLAVCAFGTPAERATSAVALVGDSHAAHWRAAVKVVADAAGLRGYSVTQSGCPLSTYPPALPEPLRSQCVRWRAEVGDWLGRHPEVRVVFTSAKAPIRRDAGRLRARVAGFRAAWRALPPSVERVVVLRDVPRQAAWTPDCVDHAVARRRPPGTSCALPRRDVLPLDAAAVAGRLGGARVVDFSSTFCGRRRCLPVVGGVLVHKDAEHLTELFAHTLGRPLLRRLRRARIITR